MEEKIFKLIESIGERDLFGLHIVKVAVYEPENSNDSKYFRIYTNEGQCIQVCRHESVDLVYRYECKVTYSIYQNFAGFKQISLENLYNMLDNMLDNI